MPADAETPPTGEPAPSATGGRALSTTGGRSALRSPVVLAVVVVALPIVVTVLAVSGRPWYATGDFAHTELLVRAIPRHPPLVGVAARVAGADGQGSTPGPSMAYLLFLPYRIGGGSGLAALWSTALLHVAGLAAALYLAKRNGGTAAAVVLAGTTLVMTRALVPDFFVQPWNVWVPLFAFIAFLMLVWGLARADVVLLPWAVLVGSHCVQTHISYTVLVGGLLGAAVVWLAVLAWRTDRVAPRRLAFHLGLSAVLLALAWLPPVIEQLRPGTGNLRKLWDEFSSPAAPYVGPVAALKAMAGVFNLAGPWVAGPGAEPTDAPNVVGLLAFVALAAAGMWVAVRRRDRDVITLQVVLGVAVALGFLSTARVFGRFFDHVIRWMWPLAACVAMASLWSLWRWVSDPVTGWGELRARRVAGAATVVAALVAVLAIGSAAVADQTYPRDSAMTADLSAQLARRLDRDATYRLEHHDPVALGSAAFGIILEMEKRGFDVGSDEAGRAGALPFRVVPRDEADAVLLYTTGDRAIEQLRADPAAVEVAFTDPRSPEERLLSVALLRDLEAQLCATGRGHLLARLDEQYGHYGLLFGDDLTDDERELLERYTDLRLPGAVFSLSPSSPLFEASARSGEETCRLLEES